MTIYLLCRNLEMLVEWKQQFAECRDVDVVMDDFAHFMDTHKVQCVVSPANSYGSMDGGYDEFCDGFIDCTAGDINNSIMPRSRVLKVYDKNGKFIGLKKA